MAGDSVDDGKPAGDAPAAAASTQANPTDVTEDTPTGDTGDSVDEPGVSSVSEVKEEEKVRSSKSMYTPYLKPDAAETNSSDGPGGFVLPSLAPYTPSDTPGLSFMQSIDRSADGGDAACAAADGDDVEEVKAKQEEEVSSKSMYTPYTVEEVEPAAAESDNAEPPAFVLPSVAPPYSSSDAPAVLSFMQVSILFFSSALLLFYVSHPLRLFSSSAPSALN